MADVSPASEDGSTDHDTATDGHEQGLVDSGEVAEGSESTEEAEAEEDAKSAENEMNDKGHDSDPFKIDKSRSAKVAAFVFQMPATV